MNRHFLLSAYSRGMVASTVFWVLLTPAHAATIQQGRDLMIEPSGLMAAITRTQAREATNNPAYRIDKDDCASIQTGPGGTPLKSCFVSSGEHFANGKNTIGLHLTAWGRKDHLKTVTLQRTMPRTNRIEYRGRHIRENWRVLPMGYEQSFTLERAPSGHGKVVLRLKANHKPKLVHGNLTWGSLHYGRLRVVDAAGQVLPSHLSAHGKTITLAFDARHAQYPVRIDPMIWSKSQTFTDPAKTASDEFGISVALNSTGTMALVGTYVSTNSKGAAYLYTRSGDNWHLTAQLTLSGPPVGQFGYSVALNRAGTIALVGATYANNNVGGAYVYKEPASGWASTSTPTATLKDPANKAKDRFGYSVALNGTGNIALVGAYATNHTPGAAYLYKEPANGWNGNINTRVTTLSAKSVRGIGSSVALDRAGNIALVGAGMKLGVANLYKEPTSGHWTSTSKPTATFTDPAHTPWDGYGVSVALNSKGTIALVGAASIVSYSEGAAYIYKEPRSGWSGTTSSAYATLTSPTHSKEDKFGYSVALNSMGNIALVGAVGTNNRTGAAYIYSEQLPKRWTNTSKPTTKLTATGSGELGVSTALDSKGTQALVGAMNTSGGGAAYVYHRPISTTSDRTSGRRPQS